MSAVLNVVLSILPIAGIAIILYQIIYQDYYILTSSISVVSNIGLYSTKIVNDLDPDKGDTYVNNDTLFMCNSRLPGNMFAFCQTFQLTYLIQIIALVLLCVMLVPDFKPLGFIAGVWCVLVGIYVYVQFDKIKYSECQDKDICSKEEQGVSFYLNIALIVIGALLILSSLGLDGLKKKKMRRKRKSN